MAKQPINVTAATLTVDRDVHAGAVVTVNRAAGCTITLPASIGKGDKYTFVVGTTITSNSFIVKVANSSDVMAGHITTSLATGAAGADFGEAMTGTDDTITMNGTTTGGIAGSFVEVEDVAVNLWRVNAALIGSGTLATSASATV